MTNKVHKGSASCTGNLLTLLVSDLCDITDFPTGKEVRVISRTDSCTDPVIAIRRNDNGLTTWHQDGNFQQYAHMALTAKGYKLWFIAYRHCGFVPDDDNVETPQHDIVILQTPGSTIVLRPGTYHKVITGTFEPSGHVDIYGSIFPESYDCHYFAFRINAQCLFQHTKEINELIDEGMIEVPKHCSKDSRLPLHKRRKEWARNAHKSAVAKEGGNQRMNKQGHKKPKKLGMRKRRRVAPAVDLADNTSAATTAADTT